MKSTLNSNCIGPFWFSDFARRVLEQGPIPRNGKKTDQAHPPIHPTKYTDNLQVIRSNYISENEIGYNEKSVI